MAYKINHADILDWAKNYDGELFDGILCDPPYELGFMGKSWDSTGIAFNVELWTELLRICKPGAHLLAFSGSRTYHRMACAIEDAGFEIRDMIEWVYGSGFPKSLNIGKAVDKIQGNERKVVGTQTLGGNAAQTTKEKGGTYASNTNAVGVKPIEVSLTKGTSEWEGYGTALKPAHEPCVLARKPIEGTVANNVLKHGTGGLNIDGSRVANPNEDTGRNNKHDVKDTNTVGDWGMKAIDTSGRVGLGRFPANLIHDGSDEVLEVFPNDSQRFFYTAKASKSERNAGLEGFEAVDVLGYEFDPDNPYRSGKMNNSNIHQLTIARTGKPPQPQKNHHPTVKPLSLTKYLANLIKPPKGGRLLVPFSGSGSEMIGALQAGWEYVEGVELTEEYIPIAEARIKHWLDKIDKQLEML